MAIETWTYGHRRTQPINRLERTRIFESIEGQVQVIEDAPMLREFPIDILWHGDSEYQERLDFLHRHRLREAFIFPLCEGINILAQVVSPPVEARVGNWGGIEVVFREVIDPSIDLEAPTTPTNLTLSTTVGQLKTTWTASTDDSGTIAEYEITIEPPEVIA